MDHLILKIECSWNVIMPYLFGPLHILVANFVDTFITSNFGLFGIVWQVEF